ncbi:hypothetical protein EJB05_53885, partial [Eragrostis curvula]
IDVDESSGQVIFPASKPSAILFVDRLSHSSKIRDESKLSLKLLRQYVRNNYPLHVNSGALSTSRMRSKMPPSLIKTGISDVHSETVRLNAWASKLMALGDKMSVMIVNDGESIPYGSSCQGSGGNPLYDILTNLLHKTRPGHRSKKTRISLVSKDAGLKLLSDDSKIEVTESLSVQESDHERSDELFARSDKLNDDITEVLVDDSKGIGTEYIDDGHAPSILENSPVTDPDKHDNDLESNATEMDDQSKSEASDMSSDIKGVVSYDVYSRNEAGGSSSEQDDGFSVLGKEFRRNEDVIYEDNTVNQDEVSDESDSKCPPHSTCSSSSSLVRDDRAYSEEATSAIPIDRFVVLSTSLMVVIGLLETLTGGSRIPSLRLRFKNEVLSSDTENITSGWNKDVLVLFSNSWCGFCQRAELVVRELHRSFRSFTSYSNSSFADAQDLHLKDRNEEYTMKGFPAIYMIDCTSNECRHLLKLAGMVRLAASGLALGETAKSFLFVSSSTSVTVDGMGVCELEELYPTLLLFPAENKSAIAYERGMSVGFLWKKRTATPHDTPQAIQFYIDDKISNSVSYDLPSHSDIVTGSILTATEKLGTAVPFDNARVLVVLADSQEGFIGLIMNKQLSWGIFKILDSSMEPIKQAPLFYGGPVVVQGYHLVSLSKVALEGYVEVIPGVFYGNIIATSRVITRVKSGERSADDLWFFLGYSGWGYSQLFDELSDGSWNVSRKPIEHLDWPAS